MMFDPRACASCGAAFRPERWDAALCAGCQPPRLGPRLDWSHMGRKGQAREIAAVKQRAQRRRTP